jgi:hypothetical protein
VGAVLRELRNPAAGLLETITEFALLLIVVMLALDSLGVNLDFITSNLTLLLSALLVVVVFLSCWGLRAPAEQLAANYYIRRMLSVGDQVQTATPGGTILSGTVHEFVPLGLILRDPKGAEHFVPARDLMIGLRRQKAVTPGQESV